MSHPAPRTSDPLKVEFAPTSDPGRDPNKQVNEDSCGYAETRLGHLMVLCDGMGGHYGGQEASRTAIATIFEVFDQANAGATPAEMLKASIEEAARRVYLLGGPPENRTRPGSTVVAMLLHERGVDVAHVGDSRAYVIRAGQIYPLTRDHSMVQGMIDAGMLTEEQAMGHPDANKITRALGMRPEVEVEVRPEPMELFTGDVLLQSSDGLTDLALGADILGATRQALASGPVQHACNVLVQLANHRGGHDNITVQMVRILEVGAKAQTTIPGVPQPVAAPQNTAGMATLDDNKAQTPLGPQVSFNAPVSPTMGDPTPAPQNELGLHGTQVMRPVGPIPPAPTAMGTTPTPTMAEAPPSGNPWTSGMYSGPPVPLAAPPPQAPQAGPQNLASYQDAGPAALPLPPPSTLRQGLAPAPTHVGTAMAPHAGGRPLSQLPASSSLVGAKPSKGGIVFVIIGLSAVIAVLILVIIWAVVLR
jgi:PPM family protein phosphatase